MENNYNVYLKNKNLSYKTIKTYNENLQKFFDDNCKLDIKSISLYIKKYSGNHSASSTKLMLCSIKSYLKYKKLHEIENQCSEIKLPTSILINKAIITTDEFNEVKINQLKYFKRRNWVIFSILFFTGIRLSELKQIKFNNINSEFIEIKGKGQKWRSIYLPNKLTFILNQNKDVIDNWDKIIKMSNNQIYKIIRKIGKEYFNKEISPHSLRRSYATNLINNNINIKIISKLLGHSSIETTSRYLCVSYKDIKEKLENVF